MVKPLTCNSCIECCANVFITDTELKDVRRFVRLMPEEEINRLRNQERSPGVCPFADIEKKLCTVYEVRPWVCRKFGYVERMQCSYNKHIPLQDFHESLIEYVQDHNGAQITEVEKILGINVTWESGIVKRKEEIK